jgi:hypothetical protein
VNKAFFQGDNPSESFQFSLAFDPAVPTTVQFTGFTENLSTFLETETRFSMGWGRTDNNWEEGVVYPESKSPANLVGELASLHGGSASLELCAP